MELLFIRMALEAEGIQYLVVGDGFGGLYPGVQLPIFNERPVKPSVTSNPETEIQ